MSDLTQQFIFRLHHVGVVACNLESLQVVNVQFYNIL